MKQFVVPEIEIKKFAIEDVLTTSSEDVEQPSIPNGTPLG